MAVATSRIMNIKLKILVIESRINIYSSSSEYKISTVTVLTVTKLELVLVTRFVGLQGL